MPNACSFVPNKVNSAIAHSFNKWRKCLHYNHIATFKYIAHETKPGEIPWLGSSTCTTHNGVMHFIACRTCAYKWIKAGVRPIPRFGDEDCLVNSSRYEHQLLHKCNKLFVSVSATKWICLSNYLMNWDLDGTWKLHMLVSCSFSTYGGSWTLVLQTYY